MFWKVLYWTAIAIPLVIAIWIIPKDEALLRMLAGSVIGGGWSWMYVEIFE